MKVGDGTSSVVIIAAEMLKAADELVKHKLHPTTVINGYRLACKEAVRYMQVWFILIRSKTYPSVFFTSFCSLVSNFNTVFLNFIWNQLFGSFKENLSISVQELGRQSVLGSAKTAMASKVIGTYVLFSPYFLLFFSIECP